MKKKIIGICSVLLVVIVILIAAFAGAGYKTVENTMELMQTVDKEEIKEMTNENLTEETIAELEGVWTIAVFGLDSRDPEELSSANSDVIMIVSVDNDTGDIKLVSVYRDTCLNTEGSRYRKANEAYARGGPKTAVEMLNTNLDLQIDDYIAVNWSAVATAINLLGGVDIDISDKEFYYINSYITETVNSTGIGSVQLTEPGLQHLDGVQAVAYCRLRYTDNDFVRTERQREVLSQLLTKAESTDFSALYSIAQVILPMTSSSIDLSDILSAVRYVSKYHLSEQTGFPFTHFEKRVEGLDYVFPDTLESNVAELHEFLYGTEDYEPSDTVKEISRQIASKGSSSRSSSTGTQKTAVETAPAEETKASKETLPLGTAAEKKMEESASYESEEETEASLPETEAVSETQEEPPETAAPETKSYRAEEHFGPGYVGTESEEESESPAAQSPDVTVLYSE